MRRRTFFVWHSWIGLTAGLLLFVVCWSGTVAVFSQDIDWLIDERLRAPPAESVAWQEIAQNFEAAHPGWRLNSIQAPIAPGHAAELWLNDPDGVMHRGWADPGSGRLLATLSYFNVQRFLRSFHMSLFIGEWRVWEIPFGYWLVGLLAFVLAASLVTSLIFYKRFWRGFFKLQTHRGAKVFWSDLHKLTGLWGLWFVTLIAVTGIWYLAEWKITDEAPYPDPPAAEGSVTRTLSISRLVAAAERAYPRLEVRTVVTGQMDSGLFEVHGQDGGWFTRDRGARVWLDARDGSTLAIRRSGEMRPLHRWIDMADPLHFGNFAGLWSKVVWFVFGLGLSGLCLTGAYLQAKRQQRQGQAEWRKAVLTAYAFTVSVLLASVWFGYQEALTYGSAGGLPEVPTGVTVTIVLFVLTMLAPLGLWVRALR
ncbi:PepSY-associated TM helix domain-containing protein [Allosphingosinicella sp.]|uniref:PepSY-associated TM helix domain-containing protein n=1 Tax=Allosphingosinicella sp. TaxID=2823234 RepID=UPI002FC262CB